MRRAWVICVIAFASACYRETFQYTCDPGEKGCICNEGLCLAGLECSQEHCVIPGCTLGTAFCNCDDGSCDGSLVCWEGAACVPSDGAEGTAGSNEGTETMSTSVSSDPTLTTTTTSATTSTSTMSSETNTEETSTTPSDTSTGDCMTGTPCDGPMLECSDYLWGVLDGICHRLPAQALPATCNENGECVAASPQDCATTMGEPHIVCEPECVEAAELCDMFDAAAAVDLEAMCVEDGQTAECGTFCFNESGSTISNYRCIAGICDLIESMPCGAYACEGTTCNDSCNDEGDCAMGYICMDGDCDLP